MENTRLTRAYLEYGRPDRQYHFAYGTLLSPACLKSLGVEPAVPAVAELRGHALCFSGESAAACGGLETVLARDGSSVWGAVYELRFREALALDAAFGARLDGCGKRFHFPVEVADLSGGSHRCLAYKLCQAGRPAPPSRERLELIVSGAEARGLPAGYIDGLRNRPSRRQAAGAPALLPPGPVSPGSLGDFPCAGCGGGPLRFGPPPPPEIPS
ncbi:MAG: gamma-glutamylcyclotransferase [Deltaproteobacteria bacterium]|jgi:hypothetical protein|nr:gamma-glutamylcyclotransferase [Deltaproteobacteria bacterium]